jgi:hypothetical protein
VRSDTGHGSLGQQRRHAASDPGQRHDTRTQVVRTARAVGVGQSVGMMGLYPRQRRRAAPPRSANRSKALRDTDDDTWTPHLSNFPISINSEIDHQYPRSYDIFKMAKC